jgi:anti-sigma regulatory factor (Ser/Thr protein kinase)
MGEVLLEIPARAEYVTLVRQVVAAAAALEPRFRDERIEDLRLAVSEAATNAVAAHADLSRSDERVVIRCDLGDDRIEVEVFDQGAGFDPEAVGGSERIDPQRLSREHGMGIPLMRVLADESEITSGGEGTCVRLVVYRSPPST